MTIYVTRVNFSFWTMNVRQNASCYQEEGGEREREREFLEYYAPYRNLSHYQPLRIFRN